MGFKSFIQSIMGTIPEFPKEEVTKIEVNNLPPPIIVPPTPTVTHQTISVTTTSSGTGSKIVSLPSSYTFPSMSSVFSSSSMTSTKSPLYSLGDHDSTTVITFFDNNGKWIVKLDQSGHVTWANGENITEAQQAFATMLVLGIEQKAGVKQSMKINVRNQVFEEVIRMAKERGPLSADDLTFMLESSKIIEKLKGDKE